METSPNVLQMRTEWMGEKSVRNINYHLRRFPLAFMSYFCLNSSLICIIFHPYAWRVNRN